MEENKKEVKKDKIERSHEAKVIDYNREPWLTDIIVYQKGSSVRDVSMNGYLTT